MSRSQNFRTREHILQVALRLFHENGYRGVSMEDIALDAGIKKANLFHYYPTKEDLGIAVFDCAATCMKEKIKAQFLRDGHSPLKIVDRMFRENAANMRQSKCCRGCFMGNLAQELSDQNEKIRLKIAEHFQFWTAQLAFFLERARRGGYFKRSMKPGESAEAILSLLEGAILLSKAKKRISALQSARSMALHYLKGFRD